tara:strand:+ start:561 stop:1241 length:681 start_codon:yes stop_codon:yes gene_type:complete
MNHSKINQRKAAGEQDPTQVSMSNTTMPGSPPANDNSMGYMGMPAQPNPMEPQGAGNLMNNPNVGKSMGNGMPQSGTFSGTTQSPYGDAVFDNTVQERMGTIGFAPPSGKKQQDVMGTRLNNFNYFEQNQPTAETLEMMLPMGLAQSATDRAGKLYGQQEPPPYQVGPMGLMPLGSIDEAQTTPAAFPMQMTEQSGDSLGLQGTPDASVKPMGMNMGMGSRNTPSV